MGLVSDVPGQLQDETRRGGTNLVCSRWRYVADVEFGRNAYSFGKIVYRLSTLLCYTYYLL